MSHTYATKMEWEPSDGDVFMVPVEVRLEDWQVHSPASRDDPGDGGWGSARVFATVGGREVELESTHCDYDWLVDLAMQDAWRQSE